MPNTAPSDVSYLQPHDIRLMIDASEAADRQDEAAQRAALARRAEAEAAEAEAAADDAALVFRTAEPPDTVVADTDGLSPMRARLVRFVAWLTALQAEHDALSAGRAKYLAEIGLPAMTEAAIKKLVADDKSGLLAMMGGSVTKHQLRSAERAKLTEKLAADVHAAEVASSAIQAVDDKLDQLSAQIDVLKSRHRSFVADVVQEVVADVVGSKLVEQANALQASEIAILGAHAAVQTLRGFTHQMRDVRVTLPQPFFSVPGIGGATATPGMVVVGAPVGHEINMPVHAQMAAKQRWADLGTALMTNPSATL